MTAYVALHELPLDRIVRAAPYDAEYGESLLGLRPGQRISVRDLLYGLILRSGNDAAYDLARAAAGSERRFVGQMNRYAAALGLSHTHYANPIGLDERGNHSSAGDLATLTRRLLEIPTFARIAASRSAELRSIRPPRRISTINELLSMAPWVNGVKTGHTFGAGYVLVGAGRRKGVELIAAVSAPRPTKSASTTPCSCSNTASPGTGSGCRSTPGRRLPTPSIAYSGGDLKLRAARTVAVGVRAGQRMRASPCEHRKRSRARSAAAPDWARRSSGSTVCGPHRFRCWRAGRCRRRARSTGCAASPGTTCPGSSWRLSGILIAVVLLMRRRTR